MQQTLNYNFDKRVTHLILQLRKNKHEAGFPFMIDDTESLPSNQVYMEYADGKIEVVEFSTGYTDYYAVRKLNVSESQLVRDKFQLSIIPQ